MTRRVVVTGIGLVTPLGSTRETTWQNLIAAKSGIRRIKEFETHDLACQIGGEIDLGDIVQSPSIQEVLPQKDRNKMDRFMQFAVLAAHEALQDSNWFPTKEESLERTGVCVGSGIGGLGSIEKACDQMHVRPKLSPFFIPSSLINLNSGHISIKYGFMGPNHSVVTACATGAHAISDAARMIACNEADVIVAGGSESAMCRLGFAGFVACRALSTKFNDTPQRASRPWDKDRDGFVMGEGAGVLIVEEYEHARKRGAKIYAEVAGYGLSGDAFHITAPESSGRGAKLAMKKAIEKANIDVESIGYLNAHGTSTPLGDEIEFAAVKNIFANSCSSLHMSSTKSAIGHLLGAAGGVEAAFCLLAMRDGVLPPTLNLDNPDESCSGINLVAHKCVEKKVDITMSNSFGFGGTNASLIFKRV